MRTRARWGIAIAIACVSGVVLLWLSQHVGGTNSFAQLQNEINQASTMAEKDHIARQGLASFKSMEPIRKLQASERLTDAQKVILIVAFSRGMYELQGRVEEIAKEESRTGRYAKAVLSARLHL